MPAAAYNKFNQFVGDLALARLNLATDALKVMLSNTQPVATNSYYADVVATELAAGAGYVAGGANVTTTSATNTSGTVKLILQPVTFTATGTMGPFRFAILYDVTPVNKTLLGWFDYSAAVTLLSGDSFQVQFDTVAGALTIA